MNKAQIYPAMFAPWLLAELFSHHPVISYLIAFGASFYIFYLSIFSPWNALDSLRPFSEQVMKPIVLLQLIFAGLMCCTSIFYFADHLGYHYLRKVHPFHVNELTYLIAKSQRLTLLAHIALVSGLLFHKQTNTPRRYMLTIPMIRLLLFMSIVLSVIAYLLKYIPAMKQLNLYLTAVAATCQILIFIKGINERRFFYTCYGGIAFAVLLFKATLSGYKENLLVYMLIFSFLAFPYFKKTIALFFLPGTCLLFYFLPTFTMVTRNLSWEEKRTPDVARLIAYNTIINAENELVISNTNWEFMTMRLSEIGMFTQYLKEVPENQPFYGLQILKNSVAALIPRILWPEKPETEKIAMERVYRANVVNRLSPVSAKTRTAIDGYLSAGLPGVFLTMFCYGLIVQWLCNKAELLFGGYHFGCVIIFNSLFQQLWRGNNLEFIINNICYGTLTMFLLFHVLKYLNVLKTSTYDHHPARHSVL